MRIVCFTENLGQGGAERQIVALARLLHDRNYDVRVVVYHGADFFRSHLDERGIPVEQVGGRNRVVRTWNIRKTLRDSDANVVVAFKCRPSFYAELASLPNRRFGLLVSERSFDYRGPTTWSRFRMQWHRLADAVVSNSCCQHGFIQRTAPWLARKSHVIHNCVDLEGFAPTEPPPHDPARLQLLVIARLCRAKNPVRFVEAVAAARKRLPDCDVTVDWYGNCGDPNNLRDEHHSWYKKTSDAVANHNLEGAFRLHAPQQDVRPLIQRCDAVCLPSIYEGFSNVLSEALASGRPALASRVGDNGFLVEGGETGFLFDAESVDDAADAIVRFARCSPEQRKQFGVRARQRAEQTLCPERFTDQYVELIERIAKRYE